MSNIKEIIKAIEELKVYDVTLYQHGEKESLHRVGADCIDNAIKEVCILERIEYNPMNLPCCKVQRVED